MLNINYRRRLSVLLLASGVLCLAGASAGEPGLSLHYEYFKDANDVYSYTPGFDVIMNLTKNWKASISAEVDGVTGASRTASVTAQDGVTRASKIPTLVDGITGASKFEFRKSQTTHLTYSNAGDVVSLGYYTSTENDYFSSAPMLDVAKDFFDRNTTIGGSVSYYDDKFVNPDVNLQGSADKNLISTQVSITQSLTPLTLVSGSVQRIHSWGYLSKPYNPVVIKVQNPTDDEIYSLHPEVLPNLKTARVLAASLVQGYTFIPDRLGSLRINYRYYFDDWALKSHTMDAEWSQYLSDGLYLRLRYRYYTQTRAEFIYANYAGTETYLSSDIKYYPFTSRTFGVKLAGQFPDDWTDNIWWIPSAWNVKCDYSVRNTKGDANLYQFYAPTSNYNQISIMTGVDYAF